MSRYGNYPNPQLDPTGEFTKSIYARVNKKRIERNESERRKSKHHK